MKRACVRVCAHTHLTEEPGSGPLRSVASRLHFPGVLGGEEQRQCLNSGSASLLFALELVPVELV